MTDLSIKTIYYLKSLLDNNSPKDSDVIKDVTRLVNESKCIPTDINPEYLSLQSYRTGISLSGKSTECFNAALYKLNLHSKFSEFIPHKFNYFFTGVEHARRAYYAFVESKDIRSDFRVHVPFLDENGITCVLSFHEDDGLVESEEEYSYPESWHPYENWEGNGLTNYLILRFP